MFESIAFPQIMLWISAIVLLVDGFEYIPVVGRYLKKIGAFLAGFSILIGVLNIIAALPF
jgi:multisubunit Na+/H+ antiporter MnhB subunit